MLGKCFSSLLDTLILENPVVHNPPRLQEFRKSLID